MLQTLQNQKPAARNDKGQRETDQVRQIAVTHGGKVSTTNSGAKHLVTIAVMGAAEDDPRLRAMMHAIEFATHGQFDRGRSYQSMTQFSARGRHVDVVVRCIK